MPITSFVLLSRNHIRTNPLISVVRYRGLMPASRDSGEKRARCERTTETARRDTSPDRLFHLCRISDICSTMHDACTQRDSRLRHVSGYPFWRQIDFSNRILTDASLLSLTWKISQRSYASGNTDHFMYRSSISDRGWIEIHDPVWVRVPSAGACYDTGCAIIAPVIAGWKPFDELLPWREAAHGTCVECAGASSTPCQNKLEQVPYLGRTRPCSDLSQLS